MNMSLNEKRLSLATIHYPNQKIHDPEAEPVPAKRWIRFLHEPMTSMDTVKDCTALGNFNGDGEDKLVLVDSADGQCRLKLFRGLSLITDAVLPEQPAGIVSFVSEGGAIPCIAVAVGCSLFIYRNMKPYYRYNVESMDLDPAEVGLWTAAKEKKIDAAALFNGLEGLKVTNSLSKMAFLSQHFLTINSPELRAVTLAKLLTEPAKMHLTNVLITCVATIKKNVTTDSAPDVLVIGTESGSLYWIDTTAFNVLGYCRVQVTPDRILTLGEFDLDSRYVISSREGDVVVLKKNAEHKFSQNVLNLKDHVVTIARSKKQVVFATKQNKLVFYTLKLRKLTEVVFTEDIVDLETFYYEPRLYSGVLVAFVDHIDLYIEGVLMDRLKSDQVDWIRFGRFGREDAVLVIGHQLEGITVMNFRRTAVLFEVAKPSLNQLSRVQAPKVSKLFTDKSLRERQNAQRIHATTQRDLFMLRMNITRSFADLTLKHGGMLPTKDTEQMTISSEVHGFGPHFTITITVAAATTLPAETRWIAFAYDKAEYFMEHQLIPMTRITPQAPTSYSNPVVCLHPEKGLQSQVKIFILSEAKKQPLWMTKFEMPVSEQSLI